MTELNKFIAECRERAEKATPGPLLEREDFDYYDGGIYIGIGPYGYRGQTEGYFNTDVARIENSNDKDLFMHAQVDITRLLAIVECLSEALEWYDNVHSKHWAIDLNDLERVAKKALTEAERIAKHTNDGEDET